MSGKELVQNKLQLSNGYSKFESVTLDNKADDICDYIDRTGLTDGTAVVGLEYEIKIINANELKELLSANEAYWLELRVFNKAGEMYLTCENDKAIGRLRLDSDVQADGMEQQEYVDSMARFWGKRRKGDTGSTMRLVDTERKLSLEIPAQETLADYYGLVTRNYIGENPVTHQAGYVDYRYLDICPADID